MKHLFSVLTTFACIHAGAQGYTSWFTGNATDVEVQPQFGLCLMGGAGESDAAMQWFLQRANGGDVLVIRASGSDGYNDYLYSELGVVVNSVETIRFDNASAATDPYVLDKLAKAEAIWIAGGNQANYVNYWRNTPVEEALNYHINVKGGPIGGISAGMAIMGQAYFGALNGGMSEAAALSNPFNPNMTIGWNDFIDAPYMQNVITDTHFNDPDAIRYGRLTTFMARVMHDHGVRALGMGSNEFCAIAIDETGLARAFGEFPEFDDDYVYLLQANCAEPSGPEVIEAGIPLTWVRNQEAVKVYKIPATVSGENYLDLNDWNSGEGGIWQNWYVDNGTLVIEDAEGVPSCFLSVINSKIRLGVSLYPNPAQNTLNIQADAPQWNYFIIDVTGRVILSGIAASSLHAVDVSSLSSGVYKIRIDSTTGSFSASFVCGK